MQTTGSIPKPSLHSTAMPYFRAKLIPLNLGGWFDTAMSAEWHLVDRSVIEGTHSNQGLLIGKAKLLTEIGAKPIEDGRPIDLGQNFLNRCVGPLGSPATAIFQIDLDRPSD